MNNIIFLDIDGVLNSSNFYKTRNKTLYAGVDQIQDFLTRKKYDIDPQAVLILKNIVLSVDNLKIVLSSTWRKLFSKESEMKEYFSKNFDINIYSRTPVLNSPRGYEIQRWLDECGLDIKKIVILDDESDMVHLKKHLFQTNMSYGLTQEIGNNIVRYFNS